MPPEPQRFGKYQIIERIAAGGMAEVFKARLEGIGGFHRTYAIKRILPHLTSNPEFVDLLVDEAKIAGLLSHANIVQILDLGAVDDQFFIAMEYVNGKDLGQLLERCAQKGITLPFPHAVYILIEMLKGLEYAHNRTVVRDGKQVPLDIVHRDVSPGNVLVSQQGEVKLTDFGIAKAVVKGMETQAGVIKGRFDYMAPEQAAGRDVDQRADLFAAGVVFYELLTGRHPFRQAGDARTLDAVRRGTVVPPSTINPDVPAALDSIIANALRVDRDQRYASATAFKDALNTFFHDSQFIFSAAQLSAFVRDLLQPEGERPTKPSEADTGPFARAARPPAPSAGAPPVARPAAEPVSLPPPGIGEESTLIRNPTIDAMFAQELAKERGIEPAPPSQWSEMETVIRPDPFGPPAPERPRARPMPPPTVGRVPVPSGGRASASGAAPAELNERGQVMRRPDAQRPTPPRRVEVAIPAEQRPRILYRTPNHVHLAYVIVCFCTLLVGLGFGVLLGRTGVSRAQPAVLQAPPAVEIHAPIGFTASLDGKPLVGAPPWSTALKTDTASVVRVQGPGYGPVEAHLQLSANQMRVLDFTPAVVPASQGK